MKRYLDYMDRVTVPLSLHEKLTRLEAPGQVRPARRGYAPLAAALALVVGLGVFGVSRMAGAGESQTALGETAVQGAQPDIAVLESAAPGAQPSTMGGYEVENGEVTSYYALPYLEYGTVEMQADLAIAPPAGVTYRYLTEAEVETLLGGEAAIAVHLDWEGYPLTGHAMVYPDGRLWMLVLSGYRGPQDYVTVNLALGQLPPTCLVYEESVVNQIGELEVTADRYVGEDSQTLRASFLTDGYGYRFEVAGTDGEAAALLVSRFVRYAGSGGLNLDALEATLAEAARRSADPQLEE